MKQNLEMNKGFTLIELLAVIVILAIIALIAVPVVMNIINKANKSAFKDSAYGLIKAGELFYTDQLLTNAGLYTDKTFTFPNNTEGLEIKGSKPTGGYVTVNKKGQVSMAVTNGKYCVTKDFEDDDVTITDDVDNCGISNKEYIIGDVVYYNPNEAKICTETEWNNNTDKNGKSGCMRWYIYGEEGNKQKLILDHNTTNSIEWISEDDYSTANTDGTSCSYSACNDEGPVTLMNQLAEDTQNWEIEADIVDVFDLVKLIPYFQELEDINTWHENCDEYANLYLAAMQNVMAFISQSGGSSLDEMIDSGITYLENNYSQLVMPRGLYRDMAYEYLIINASHELGYWTKTTIGSYKANAVGYMGAIGEAAVADEDFPVGLRPVIQISK